jgi:hypothetical protein
MEYNVHAADALRNTEESPDEQSNPYISGLIKSLNLDKEDLSKFKKRTATATARAIIRSQFPNPTEDFCFANVDSLIIDNIIREFHLMYLNFSMTFLLHRFSEIFESD